MKHNKYITIFPKIISSGKKVADVTLKNLSKISKLTELTIFECELVIHQNIELQGISSVGISVGRIETYVRTCNFKTPLSTILSTITIPLILDSVTNLKIILIKSNGKKTEIYFPEQIKKEVYSIFKKGKLL